jgi:predicted membrane protein
MKTWKIFWGLGFVLAALFLLLDALGVITPFLDVVGGISAAQVICGLFLIAFVISRIIKLKLHEIFIPLALLFMLFEDNVAFLLGLEDDNIIGNWLLFWCAVLLSVGVSILTPKNRVLNFKITKKGTPQKTHAIGASTSYIDCEDFVEEHIINNLGETVIHFENEANFTSGAVLHIENKLGETVVYVPEQWNVKLNITSKLGGVVQKGKGNADGPTLVINGTNELGEVVIMFI